jgi:flagellar assembly factor FliW
MTSPALQLEEQNLTRIESVVLGEIEVPASSIMHFPDGLRGFETHSKFALIPAARQSLFWLQSLSDSDIAFLVVDPFVASPGYEVDLGATERLALGLNGPEDVLILTIVTLSPVSTQLPTTNLRGPIVLNVRTGTGRQVVTTNESHDVQCPVDVLALPEN